MRGMIRPLVLLLIILGWALIACQSHTAANLTPTPIWTITLRSLPTATRSSSDARPPTRDHASPSPRPVTPTRPSPTATPLPYPITTPATETPVRPTARPTATQTPHPTITPTRAHPVYDGPPLDRSEVGIQVHLHREDIGSIFEHLRALRVGWVKVQVSWKLFEPEPGRYDLDRFDELDQLVANASSSDIYVLLSVAKAPEWSRPTTELDGPPTDYGLYRAFMSLLAQRYKGSIAAYELWNEPNLRREWNSAPLDAGEFIKLVSAGAAGVSEIDPLAILVSGAPAPTGINDRIEAIDDREYLREMLAAGVADIVDAIGAHPYGWANPPDASATDASQVAPTHNQHPSFFFHDTLWDYFSILNAAGRPEMQVWVTEFGWGSFDGMGANAPVGAEYMTAVDEYQQASYTLLAFELAHQWRWVGPLFLWNLNFAPLLGTDFSESGYSLLRPDGSPRPVYLALQTMLTAPD